MFVEKPRTYYSESEIESESENKFSEENRADKMIEDEVSAYITG